MKRRSLAVLELLSRRRYGRTNFLTAYMGGSQQNARKEIGALGATGRLTLHPPKGSGDITRSYTHYFHRIYEKPSKHPKAEQFWHQVLIDDILISTETAARRAGISFTDRDDILKGRPFELPANISYAINGKAFLTKRAITCQKFQR